MSARRIYCHGNCGRFWYYDPPRTPGHAGGRPQEWCPKCFREHRREKNRLDREYRRIVLQGAAR